MQEFVRLLKQHILATIDTFAEVETVIDYPGQAEGLLKSCEVICRGRVPSAQVLPLEGSHALIKKSDMRPGHGRKRWFAGVTVEEWEELPKAAGELNPEDIEITACLSSGPGGQKVNKTATKIRVLHRPTGLVVTSSQTRSQSRNRKIALELLAARLAAMEEASRGHGNRQKWLGLRQVERGNPVAVYEIQLGRLKHWRRS